MRVEHHAKCTYLFSTSYYVCIMLYYVFVYFNNIKMAKYYRFKHFFEICFCVLMVLSLSTTMLRCLRCEHSADTCWNDSKCLSIQTVLHTMKEHCVWQTWFCINAAYVVNYKFRIQFPGNLNHSNIESRS